MPDDTQGPWTELLEWAYESTTITCNLTLADAQIADASKELHEAVTEYLDDLERQDETTSWGDFHLRCTRPLARAADWKPKRPERRDGIDRRRSDG